MKFGTIILNGTTAPVLQGNDRRVRLVSDVAALAGIQPVPDILSLIKTTQQDASVLKSLQAKADEAADFDLSTIEWAAPVTNPSKILGVAFNNKELMKKAHRDPGVPNFFLKPPSALIGHGKAIIVDPDWGAVIPEPEICAVIGKRAKHISEDQALDHVFGFMIHNDVTSHGLKFQKDSIAVTYDKDMARPEFYTWRHLNGPDDTDAYYVYHTRSKGTDTFAPMGPWITTTDVVGNPNDLHVKGTLDNETFTLDHTGNYRFTVEQCIAEASRYFTLEPGDLISFGTTGKGAGRFPRGHKSLLIGEEQGTIGIEIEPLGRLENPIRHQKGGA
ncbi:fumarylacetoacetate hydrolase family protein [uncultured Ruegeria sp.]|uniref:fumarylacetoacetate hydrolase family protein n=1 Tax=uncultured Ruegeria sp. TaxID=259304 RepID=UPI00261EE506|nr:fumarylacetoacetate hydrolase family protein [uncultured Ruegeria sp.]